MPSPSRIILCGQSVFLMAIEAGLAALPNMEVKRLNSHLPTILEQIITWQPVLVVIEQNQGCGDLALALVSRNLPVLALTAEHEQALLLTGHAISVTSLAALPQLIKQKQLQ